MSNTRRSHRRFHPSSRVEFLEARSLLSVAGSLDPTFGNGQGSIQADPGIPLTEPDGKILVVGVSPTIVPQTTGGSGTSNTQAVNFELQQFNANGTPDTTYGTNGRIITSSSLIPAGFNESLDVVSAALQPNGDVVLVGLPSNRISSAESVYVVRLETGGTLDPTFGTGGIVTLPGMSGSSPYVPFEPGNGAIAIQSNGQIVLGGSETYLTSSGSSSNEFAAIRLNTDGSIDTAFGVNGESVVPFLDGLDQSGAAISNAVAASIAIDPTGQIVLGGTAEVTTSATTTGGTNQSTQHLAAVRLNTNGSLDTSFGGSTAAGLVILPVVANPEGLTNVDDSSLALQTDGKIVLGGSGGNTSGQFVVDRLNADGTVDTSFEENGQSIVSLPSGVVESTGGLVIQASGEIALSGQLNNPQGPAIIRLLPNGTPDSSFSNTTTAGLVIFNKFNNTSLQGPTVLENLPDGNILFGTGQSSLDPTSPFDLASVLAPTPAVLQPPADDDGSGQTNLAVYLPTIGAFAYRPTNGSADVIVPFGIPGAGQTIPAPGDYTGAGQTEIAAYLPSQGIYAYRPAKGGPDVLESFGIAGSGQSIPVPGDYFGTGQDDVAVYMPSLGAFGIRNPNGGPDEIIPFGLPGAGQTLPAPGDYFGTGQTDIAAYLLSIGAFAIRNPNGGPDEIIPFGSPGAGNSIPIPGDYDGSGKTELAVYLPKLGEFAYRPANGGPDVIVSFGAAGTGAIPVPGDYTGVGYDEIGIYEPDSSTFAYRPASGSDVIVSFGAMNSLPLAAPVIANVPVTGTVPVTIQSVATPTSSTASVTVTTKSVAIPGGPMASTLSKGSTRNVSTRPAQADPSKPLS